MKRLQYCISVNILIWTLLLSGCGFHLRRPEDLPPQLHTLYLTSPNPYGGLTVQLVSLLKSMHVDLVPYPQAATASLKILSETFTHTHPNIFSTALPTNYYYYLTVTVLLTDPQGVPLGPVKTFQVQQTVSLIGNQILVPGTSEPIDQSLTRRMVNTIFNWLTIQEFPHAY